MSVRLRVFLIVRPTFEVDIRGVLEVIIEMHLKMHMVVCLLVQKNSQNNSIKGEL